jgi:uncharacterized protein YggE
MKRNAILAILALTLAACSGQNATTSDTQTDHIISVTATGQVPIQPDIAFITIGVHSSSEDVAIALNENSRQIDRVTQILKDQFQIAENDIQTANFNLYGQDQFNSMGEQIVTYSVDNSVYVTVRNLDMLGEILNAVVQNGANSIWGIQFDIADKSAALDEARTLAVKNAQEQAETLAEAAGLTLGEIQSIVFNGNGYPTQYFWGVGGGGGGEDTSSVSISAGQLTISVNVNITYELIK